MKILKKPSGYPGAVFLTWILRRILVTSKVGRKDLHFTGRDGKPKPWHTEYPNIPADSAVAQQTGWCVTEWEVDLYKAGKIKGPVVFFVLKAHRGPKNWPTDKSWVSFEKFRKFSIRWALRFLNLDQRKLRNLHLKIVTFILKSLIDDPNSPDWVSHK